MRRVEVTLRRPVVPTFSAWQLRLSRSGALATSPLPASLPLGSLPHCLRLPMSLPTVFLPTERRILPLLACSHRAALRGPVQRPPPPGSLPALPLKCCVHSPTLLYCDLQGSLTPPASVWWGLSAVAQWPSLVERSGIGWESGTLRAEGSQEGLVGHTVWPKV